MSVSIQSITKEQAPSLPFAHMKDKVLGPDYELSLVFADSAKMQELNREYRKKDADTNVLSFSLSESSGEIFLSPAKIRSEADEYGETFEYRVAFLFIHGLHHLKGLDHGSRMDREEMEVRRFFNLEK